ncbi:MAG TPA: CehA/McbA family metallohydrolase, partial [Rugosimonospora sp.]|nr:CehA/McbA family metallohydrolase [Rugosimonospora sp.]
PERPARGGPAPPAPPGYRWLAGDLHAHTEHSDGVLTVPALARLAAAQGLDFLAVTEHNTVSHHPLLGAERGVLLLPGQELTTGRGHANAFGDIGWVDFRAPAADWLSTVEERGGLLSVNHPLAADFAWLHPLPAPPHLAEVWHSGWWDRSWTAPLAWLLAVDPRLVPVGGSDFHDPADGPPPGTPTTWVLCPVEDPRDATVGMVLDGLRAGRVGVSESPSGPLLLPVDGELVVLGGDGALLAGLDGRRQVVRGELVAVPARPGACWLEDHRGTVLAVSASPRV